MFLNSLVQGMCSCIIRHSPYYGQFFHFYKYHSEKFPSAIDRYKDEILRIFGVLESVLSKQQWLVGNKMTIADLSFVV